MGLYDGFSAVGSSVTNKNALQRWAANVSHAADTGDAHGAALEAARATGVPLSSPLGRWLREVSVAADAAVYHGSMIDTLKAAQISMSSPFGKWAQRLSQTWLRFPA